MADETVKREGSLTWDQYLATLPDGIQKLYNAYVEALKAEIASNRKERDALKKELQQLQKKQQPSR